MSVNAWEADRMEFLSGDGVLYHQAHQLVNGQTFEPDQPVAHEGEWLKCHGCHPVKVIQPGADEHGPFFQLAEARAEYEEAKTALDAAAEREKAANAKLKRLMTEAAGGAIRSSLHVPGYTPVNLTYSESWRLDNKRMQADHGPLYASYCKQTGSWKLERAKGSR